MRYERRRSLSTPPSEGFPVRFRLPDGTAITWSFTSDMDILVCITFGDLSTEQNSSCVMGVSFKGLTQGCIMFCC